MLKVSYSVKEIEERGAAELERLLKRIPRTKLKSLKMGPMQNNPGFDVQVRMELDGKQHTLIAEVKSSGQPRYAREAILRLKSLAARSNPPAIPVFIAPFLTESTRDLCFQQGVSCLDFEGNARMAFDSVYLELSKPPSTVIPAARVPLTLQRAARQRCSAFLSAPRIAIGNSPTLRGSRASALAMSAMFSPRFWIESGPRGMTWDSL